MRPQKEDLGLLPQDMLIMLLGGDGFVDGIVAVVGNPPASFDV